MSFDYSIAAIPTLYRGRQYRSRLEARWAAFFDLVGLKNEYEPYDLGAWSPDFLLTDLRTLVEIKPIRDFDQDTWDKAIGACRDRRLFDQEQEFPMRALFLSCVAPIIKDRLVQIGWFTQRKDDAVPVNAYLAWLPDYETPTLNPTIASIQREGWFSVCGDADSWLGTTGNYPLFYPRYAADLWARASNTVQWQGSAR